MLEHAGLGTLIVRNMEIAEPAKACRRESSTMRPEVFGNQGFADRGHTRAEIAMMNLAQRHDTSFQNPQL